MASGGARPALYGGPLLSSPLLPQWPGVNRGPHQATSRPQKHPNPDQIRPDLDQSLVYQQPWWPLLTSQPSLRRKSNTVFQSPWQGSWGDTHAQASSEWHCFCSHKKLTRLFSALFGASVAHVPPHSILVLPWHVFLFSFSVSSCLFSRSSVPFRYLSVFVHADFLWCRQRFSSDRRHTERTSRAGCHFTLLLIISKKPDKQIELVCVNVCVCVYEVCTSFSDQCSD